MLSAVRFNIHVVLYVALHIQNEKFVSGRLDFTDKNINGMAVLLEIFQMCV